MIKTVLENGSVINSTFLHPISLSFDNITVTTSKTNFHTTSINSENLDFREIVSNATFEGTFSENGTIFTTDEYIFDRGDVRAVFLVFYTIVFCSCFFGNLMVILVVTLHWRMRSITNFCLANLAFADLCVGIFCVYQNIITYLMESWIFGEFMCKMYHFINSLSTTASVLILVVICIERYLAIIHPMTCKQMLTLNRLRITIVLVWILSAVISSPRFYYFRTITIPVSNTHAETICVPDRNMYNSTLLDMISMTVLFIIPLTIITILYAHIGVVLWKSSRTRMGATSSATPSVENSSSSVRSFYREATEHNVLQSVNLTMLPVGVQPDAPGHRSSPHLDRSDTFLCLRCQRECRKSRNKLVRKNTFNQCPQCAHQNRQDETSFINSASYQNGDVPHCDSSQQQRNEAITASPSPQRSTSCCKSRTGILCTRLQSRSLESTTSETPPSPFCTHNCSCLDDTITCSKTDPIVLVKFDEKGLRQAGAPHKKENYCTFLLNTRKCQNHHQNGCAAPRDACCNRVVPKDESNYASCKLKRNPSVDSGISGMKSCSSGQPPPLSNKQVLPGGKLVEGDPRRQESFEEEPKLISSENKCHHHHHQNSIDCPQSRHPPTHRQNHRCSHPRLSSSSSPPRLAPKRPRRMRVVRSSKYGTSALQSRRRIIRMLIVVVLTFALCHLPFHARKVWQYWSPSWAPYQAGGVFSTVFTPITFLIMYANSGVNPILYAFMSKKFRMSFRDLLCCRMRHSLRISRNASLRSTHAIALSQTGL